MRAGSIHAALMAFLARFGILLAWVAVIIAFSALRPSTFFTAANFQTIFGSQAVLLILTLGLLLSLTAGEFDLSFAGVMSVSLILVGYLNVLHHWPVGLAVLAAMGVGVLIGVFNAFLVIVIGVESIVATLGTGTILLGVGVGINNLTIGGISNSLVTTARYQVFGIPLAFYYGLALTIILWYVYSFTPLGRYLFFVGAGRSVARLSGIRVDAVRAGALIGTSGISALAGVLFAGTLGASDPNVSTQFLLPAFAAAFLGSTAVTPGRFNPWGAFIAVYFLVTGITGLELLGLAGWIENVFYGGSLVVAVVLSRLAARHGEARRSAQERAALLSMGVERAVALEVEGQTSDGLT
jgi:ribose transport system permease protein